MSLEVARFEPRGEIEGSIDRGGKRVGLRTIDLPRDASTDMVAARVLGDWADRQQGSCR